MSERRLYQLTERDLCKAAEKRRQREAVAGLKAVLGDPFPAHGLSQAEP